MCGGKDPLDGGLSDFSIDLLRPPLLPNECGDEGLLLLTRCPGKAGIISSPDLFRSDGYGRLLACAAKGDVRRWCSALVLSELACIIMWFLNTSLLLVLNSHLSQRICSSGVAEPKNLDDGDRLPLEASPSLWWPNLGSSRRKGGIWPSSLGCGGRWGLPNWFCKCCNCICIRLGGNPGNCGNSVGGNISSPLRELPLERLGPVGPPMLPGPPNISPLGLPSLFSTIAGL